MLWMCRTARVPAPDPSCAYAEGWPGPAFTTLQDILAPPPLAGVPASAMLAVAVVPGAAPEEWRHVASGTWIAWPHAAGAVLAEEMTAAQLRDLLAARGGS